MSRFMNSAYASLAAYTPGEQPKNMEYVKLNTNESPFKPPLAVAEAIKDEGAKANLYCDPECALLRQKAAKLFGVEYENVMAFNGSDEVLNFAFMAFAEKGVAYPKISYGFYPVFAQVNGINAVEIPLQEDFSINYTDYCGIGRMVVIANPNAPTGLCLSAASIEEIAAENPDSVVVVDEAYIAFGGESVIPLTKKYENLLVTRTFSKSHSLAGARLGFGIGNARLIEDINRLRYSANPYNVNRMTQAAGCAAIDENEYYIENCGTIAQNREYTAKKLREMGFYLTDSKANFLFAKSPDAQGERLYRELKKRGVLVRWFPGEGISDYVRITVGTREQMDIFLNAVKEVINYESK